MPGTDHSKSMDGFVAINVDLVHQLKWRCIEMISKHLRESAKGEECTFNIAGVCNYRNETVVLCHLPDESNGMGKKSDDISAAFACSACHDVIDGRVRNAEYKAGKCYYNFRAFKRTLRKWIEMDLIAVKGLK